MSVPNATESAAIVDDMVKFPVPSKEPEPVTSPLNAIVLEVASAVAVSALPSKFASKVPVECPVPEVSTVVVGSVWLP